MNSWQLIWKGAWFYRKLSWGLIAGAAVGAMVLLGALMAGDSVQHMLEKSAQSRTGKVDRIFSGGEGFFPDDLGQRTQGEAILFLEGQINVDDRAEGQVQIIGVNDPFWQFAPKAADLSLSGTDVAISSALAASLDLAEADSFVIRLHKPGLLSRDAPLSGEGESIASLRVTVRKILGDDEFGRFSLRSSQLPPSSVFLNLATLQDRLDLTGKANLLLLREDQKFAESQMTLQDFGLSIVEVPGGVEVRSERIFLHPKVAEKLPGEPVLTYLINTMAKGEKETPYSMATAVSGVSAAFLPIQPGPDEVVINDWLAEDLEAATGDELRFDYYVVEGGSQLVERSKNLRIVGVVPLSGTAADRRWMPDFPGLADVESARDWEPGLPLDLTRIRDKDDDYWEKHRGTPKAWVSFETGLNLWANRWGKVTGIRLPGQSIAAVEAEIRPAITPALAGMQVLNFSGKAMEAAQSPVDFAVLFLSMSFFLILAAIGLIAMLFRFQVEQRTTEGALLAAVGVSPKKITRWRMGEALVMIVIGCTIGALLSIAFCSLILRVIESIWGSPDVSFTLYAKPATLTFGILGMILISLGAVWFTIRKQARQGTSLRLNSGSEEPPQTSHRAAWAMMTMGGFMILAGLILKSSMGPQGAFFLVGFGVLLLGLGLFRRSANQARSLADLTLNNLAKLNLNRRISRSITVVGVLASGVFLVLSIASFRKGETENSLTKSGGSGGFFWWVETTSPVNRPADAEGDIAWFERESIIPIRVGTGDDVDCFNLSASDRPRLLGVDPNSLEGRFATTVDWSTLRKEGIPALVDETTLMWVLKKKVGDRLTYQNEWGEDFEITIVGTLKDSIFQGSLIISEENLLAQFPSLEGYRLFLSPNHDDQIPLQRQVADYGGKVTATADRLKAFHEVENTYIAIFHVLGGLGILLGSIGVGIVASRNLIERRDEFSTLKFLGISKKQRASLARIEVRTMVIWGLAIGWLSAMISVIPVLGGTVSWLDLAWMLALVLAMAFAAMLFGNRALKHLP